MKRYLPALLLFSHAVGAACPEKLTRIPDVVELSTQESTIPRPKSVDVFSFIGDSTTLDEVRRAAGPPDAARGTTNFYWCLADGTVVWVATKTGTDIRYVRVNNKVVYKRK